MTLGPLAVNSTLAGFKSRWTAFRVQRRERLRESQRQCQLRLRCQRSRTLDQIIQRFAVHVLGGKPGRVRENVKVKKRSRVRPANTKAGLDLLLETPQGIGRRSKGANESF